MIKTIPYCGVNRHIDPPERVMALARKMAEGGQSVTIAPVEGAGNYTIPPLEGWKITTQHEGRTRRLYFDKEGISLAS